MLEPEKRTARFSLQGREVGAEPRAICEASEHGEHPPLVAGFVMILGLYESKGVHCVKLHNCFGLVRRQSGGFEMHKCGFVVLWL